MKNRISQIVKLSGFAAVVMTVSSADVFAQGGAATAPRVAPRATTTTSTVNNVVQTVTTEGKALQIQGRAQLEALLNRGVINQERFGTLYRNYSQQLRTAEVEAVRTGVKVTPAVAEGIYASVISGVFSGAQAEAQMSAEISSFKAAVASNVSAVDFANDIVGTASNAASSQGQVANVSCAMLDGVRGNGIAAADGIMSRANAVDVTTAAYMQDVRNQLTATAKKFEGLVNFSFPELTVESFTAPNGQPVSLKGKGTAATLEIFFTGSSVNPESIDVGEGAVGVTTVLVDVANGVGKDITDPNVFWALAMGELTNRLTPVVGATSAQDIVDGALVDANQDGKIDALDNGARAGGIRKECATAFGFNQPV